MHTRRTMAVALTAMLFGAALPDPARAQATIETQRGAPPALNTPAPEYAPTPASPSVERPAIDPPPGKPALAPAPGAIGDRDQTGKVAGSRTILGLRPMTAFLVGLGLVGLLILALGAMGRRPGAG